MSELYQQLRQRFGERVKVNEPLAPYTSFRIGGPADLMLVVESEQELCDALKTASHYGVPTFCLGAGTNLLISDRGVRGLVVKLGKSFDRIEIEGTNVKAGGAVIFRRLVETTIEAGLSGLEFAEGIPGTVGGGLLMNAGAFGGELSAAVAAVHGVTMRGEKLKLERRELRFDYRAATLPEQMVITWVEFALSRGEKALMRARVEELRAKRAARQPTDMPNAGSVFKNPPGNFAAKLLEACGLKDKRIGGAAFSQRHANFIVNLGSATAADVKKLIETAQAIVEEKTGIKLEPEVKLVGEW